MPSLLSIHSFGSEQSKRTGWLRWPGFSHANLSDGTRRTFSEKESLNSILLQLDSAGISTADFRAKMEARRVADYAATNPGPRELAAEEYQHHYGYEKPVSLGDWSWSTTFGRWSRLVTFADGWHGYTYPRL